MKACLFAPLLVIAATTALSQTDAAPDGVPPGFDGAVFVDRSGCAFSRVELGDTVRWAAQLDAAGNQICAQTPSIDPPSASEALVLIPRNRRGTVPDFPEAGDYIQIGAFGARRADSIVTDLTGAGFSMIRQDFRRGGATLRVLFVGPFATVEETQDALQRLRLLGFGDAFVRDRGQ